MKNNSPLQDSSDIDALLDLLEESLGKPGDRAAVLLSYLERNRPSMSCVQLQRLAALTPPPPMGFPGASARII